VVVSQSLSRSRYGSWNPGLQLGIDASIATGFSMCLRPGEYLYQSGDNGLDHVLLGDNGAFKWDSDPTFYCCLYPSPYPVHVGTPSYFVQLPSSFRDDLWGKGGPIAVARAPPSAPFCCASILHAFLRQFPPIPGCSLLSGSLTTLSVALVNAHCKRVAVLEGLDPSRLVPHSFR
jgi:hypothetical protein